MKGWQYVGDNVPIALNDVPEPVIAPTEVLLEVKAAGICHTDVGFLDGSISSQLAFSPITLGHEVAGVVAATGEQVHGFEVGDRVAVTAAVAGPGTSSHGGFQPRIAVRADLVVPVPDQVPWDQAAVSTDAGATSYHALMSRGRARPSDKIGIIGMGGLGSLGVQIAVGLGAEVYVAETNERLFGYARELGATAVATDIAEYRDVGLNLICDFAGYGSTTAAAVDVAAEHGRIVQVGLGRRHGTIDLVRLTLRQLELLGSVGGSTEDNAQVLSLMSEGKIAARTTIVGFDDVGDAVRRLDRGEVIGRLVVRYE